MPGPYAAALRMATPTVNSARVGDPGLARTRPRRRPHTELDVRWIDLDGVDAPEDDLRYRAVERGAAILRRAEGAFWQGDRAAQAKSSPSPSRATAANSRSSPKPKTKTSTTRTTSASPPPATSISPKTAPATNTSASSNPTDASSPSRATPAPKAS
jgi:hypothetical protein